MDNLTIIKQNNRVLKTRPYNNRISSRLKEAYWNCLLAKEYIKLKPILYKHSLLKDIYNINKVGLF